MGRFRTPEMLLGCFLAVAIFAMGMLFSEQLHSPGAHQSSEFWSAKLTDWLLAILTFFLALFTYRLWKSTDKLWQNAAEDTRIIQRAYVTVDPGGIVPAVGGERPNCIATIEIVNSGNLPAQRVRWSVEYAFDLDSRRPREQLPISKDAEGDNIVPPKGRMTQGARDLIYVGRGQNQLGRSVGKYLYVWGVVAYHDGFKGPRRTHFCHRYNCANVRNVSPDVNAPNAFRFDAAAEIPADKARFHRYGNDAD